MRPLIVIAVLASSASSVFAQAATAPTETSPWDAAAVVAAFAARPSDTGRGYDRWSNSGAAGVSVGRHLSPHLKIELDFMASGEGHHWVQRFVHVPGSAAALPVGAERYTRVRVFSASLVRQFFDNQWAHPFLQVGLAVDADRVHERSFPQQVYIGGSRPENLVVLTSGDTDPVTTTRVRLLLGCGTKAYVTPRVFLRTDARFALDRAVRSLAVRAGFGVDF